MTKRNGNWPRVRWKVKAPPAWWIKEVFGRAKKNKKVKKPVALVRWTWESFMSPAERAAVRRRKNPFVSDDQLKAAVAKYEEFAGQKATKGKWVNIPEPPRVCVFVGDIRQINYQAAREGNPEKVEYYHRFKKPFPKLVADPKTGKLYIAGGNYRLTARGIVG